MLNCEKRIAEAKYLVDRMNTVWDEYDFSETSLVYERRVPKIRFDLDVNVMVNEVHRITNRANRYVREVQIEYNGNIYIFELSTCLDSENKPYRYCLDVYVPAGDAKGGVVKVCEVRSL